MFWLVLLLGCDRITAVKVKNRLPFVPLAGLSPGLLPTQETKEEPHPTSPPKSTTPPALTNGKQDAFSSMRFQLDEKPSSTSLASHSTPVPHRAVKKDKRSKDLDTTTEYLGTNFFDKCYKWFLPISGLSWMRPPSSISAAVASALSALVDSTPKETILSRSPFAHIPAIQSHVAWTRSDGDKLYVFGGCDRSTSSCVSTVRTLSFGSGLWTEHSVGGATNNEDLKVYRGAGAFDTQSGQMFVFGGIRMMLEEKSQQGRVPKYSNAVNYVSDDTGVWMWHQIQVENSDLAGAMGNKRPLPGADATLTATGHSLVLFGGCTDAHWTNQLWELQMLYSSSMAAVDGEHGVRYVWRIPQVKGKPPSARCGHTATLADRSIYIFGGTTDGRAVLSDVHVLQLPSPSAEDQTWKWMLASPVHVLSDDVPSPRAYHSAALVNSYQILFFGGCDMIRELCFDDLRILDTINLRWEPLPHTLVQQELSLKPQHSRNLPSARMRHTMTAVGPTRMQLVVAGGLTMDASDGPRDLMLLDMDAVCPGQCTGQGLYQEGLVTGGPDQCVCTAEFEGKICSKLRMCLGGCTGEAHGQCVEAGPEKKNHYCMCNPEYWGPTCAYSSCPNACNGNGICTASTTYVSSSSSSSSSSASSSSSSSQGQGGNRESAITTHCECKHPFYGVDCSLVKEPIDVTNTTFPDCNSPQLLNCSGHGLCKARLSSNNNNNNNNNVNNAVNHQALPQGIVGSVQGMCECEEGFYGVGCEKQCPYMCSGTNGRCNSDGTCTCKPGFTGLGCTEKYCHNECSNHGNCVNNECVCSPPFMGDYCQLDTSCSQHGIYEDGRCVCDSERGWPDCSQEFYCPASCSSHGRCVEPPTSPTIGMRLEAFLTMKLKKRVREPLKGVCVCDEGYSGVRCSDRRCPRDCSSNGVCDTGMGLCQCYPGYDGEDCAEVIPCPSNCTDARHGLCQPNGKCNCLLQWQGETCESLACLNNCSSNGRCVEGHCACTSGYAGIDCSVQCPSGCSDAGHCLPDGRCVCQVGREGEDCSREAMCPFGVDNSRECSGHGVCDRAAKKCYCAPGYSGDACETLDGSCGVCVSGTCSRGHCFCDFGYEGEGCITKSKCKHDCSGRGFCLNDMCHCYAGFEGEYCQKFTADTTCLNNCSSQGLCRHGRCFCIDGYDGRDCTEVVGFCKNNKCSNNGFCKHNRCFCEPGASGPNCEHAGCPQGCHVNSGTCRFGKCECLEGYTGADCSQELRCPGSGPHGCSNHGICIRGTCACEPGWGEADCSLLTVAGDFPSCHHLRGTNGLECSGRGVCHLGKCFCIQGAEGHDCSLSVAQACPSDCQPPAIKDEHGEVVRVPPPGECLGGICFCTPDYTGPGCQQPVRCDKRCERNGICFHGKCLCLSGFEGPSCEVRQLEEARHRSLELDYLDSTAHHAHTQANNQLLRNACPADLHSCNDRGVCTAGKCVCALGYGGLDCSTAELGVVAHRCLDQCHLHGQCLFGKCYCDLGWAGLACERAVSLPCPYNCHSRGFCHWGKCYCDPPYSGLSCEITDVDLQMKLLKAGEVTEVYGDSEINDHDQSLAKTNNNNNKMKKNSTTTTQQNSVRSHPVAAMALPGTTCGGCGAHGACIDRQTQFIPGVCLCARGWGGLDCTTMLDVPTSSASLSKTTTTPMPIASSESKYTKKSKQLHKPHAFVDVTSSTHNEWPACSGDGPDEECGHNGACVNHICYCAPGFTGIHCATAIQMAGSASELTSLLHIGSQMVATTDPSRTPVMGTKSPRNSHRNKHSNTNSNGNSDSNNINQGKHGQSRSGKTTQGVTTVQGTSKQSSTATGKVSTNKQKALTKFTGGSSLSNHCPPCPSALPTVAQPVTQHRFSTSQPLLIFLIGLAFLAGVSGAGFCGWINSMRRVRFNKHARGESGTRRHAREWQRDWDVDNHDFEDDDHGQGHRDNSVSQTDLMALPPKVTPNKKNSPATPLLAPE